jgi:hypothetical protein
MIKPNINTSKPCSAKKKKKKANEGQVVGLISLGGKNVVTQVRDFSGHRGISLGTPVSSSYSK